MSERALNRKAVVAGLILGSFDTLLGSDAVVGSEQGTKMEQAAAARRAIAERYAGCVITDVVDTHTSEVRTEKLPDDIGLPYRMEGAPRNEVIITVKATKNAASMAAEQTYANGTPDEDIVRWHPFSLGAATDIIRKDDAGKYSRIPIPRKSTAKETGPSEETFTITMYPRTDKRRTTSADVSLLTYAETYDHENGDGVTYIDTGRMTCGSIREVLMNGLETWQVVPGDTSGVPRFESYHGMCANVPSVDQPGMYTRECS